MQVGVSKWTKKLENVFYSSSLAFDRVRVCAVDQALAPSSLLSLCPCGDTRHLHLVSLLLLGVLKLEGCRP